jgi:hypothetical protein
MAMNLFHRTAPMRGKGRNHHATPIIEIADRVATVLAIRAFVMPDITVAILAAFAVNSAVELTRGNGQAGGS